MGTVDNRQDILDSRDIIARIDELEADEDDQDFDEDDHHDLDMLRDLANEASGYSEDWQYGEALIRDSYFTEYAEQVAEDIGAINRDSNWPLCCIDWEDAAEQLQQDYTSVDFDGVEYWIR